MAGGYSGQVVSMEGSRIMVSSVTARSHVSNTQQPGLPAWTAQRKFVAPRAGREGAEGGVPMWEEAPQRIPELWGCRGAGACCTSGAWGLV